MSSISGGSAGGLQIESVTDSSDIVGGTAAAPAEVGSVDVVIPAEGVISAAIYGRLVTTDSTDDISLALKIDGVWYLPEFSSGGSTNYKEFGASSFTDPYEWDSGYTQLSMSLDVERSGMATGAQTVTVGFFEVDGDGTSTLKGTVITSKAVVEVRG